MFQSKRETGRQPNKDNDGEIHKSQLTLSDCLLCKTYFMKSLDDIL